MGQGHECGGGRGANVLLTGDIAISRDDGALRDPRSADPMYGNGYPHVVRLPLGASGLQLSVLGYALRPLVVLLINAFGS